MVQGCAIPVTWVQVLLEPSAEQGAYGHICAVTAVVKEHTDPYRIGVVYAQALLGAHAAG
jgi:hypothetical protein